MTSVPETDPGLARSLAKVRAEIDRVLVAMDENKLEARRQITRELAIDPSAEQLQTMFKMAHDAVGLGPLKELSRESLAVRILVDRELKEVFDSAELDSTSLSRAALVMPGLLKVVAALEEEIRARILELKDEERDYMLQVGDSLIPPSEPLIAASVIAPRLALFAYATQRGQLDSAVLSEEDVELLTSAAGAGEERSDATVRTCVNAMVLRTAIQDDLVAWKAAHGDAASESDGPSEGLLQRLERDATAYHVIAEQLQKQQDLALLAGLQEFADELRRSKQKLFSTYLQLAAARKSATAPSPGQDAGEDQDAALKRLLEECAAADAAIVSEQAGQESTDQLCLDALNKIHGKQTPVVTFILEMGAEDLRREKSRIKSMLTVTAVLLTAVVIVYGTILGSTPADIHVPLTSVPGRLRPVRAVSVGPMMYAQVDRWTWNRLPEGQQLAQVNELGHAAVARGFSTVYLTDENDVDLAHWTKTDGAKLLDPVRRRPGGRAAATRR